MEVCCSILFCPRLQVLTCGFLLYAVFDVIVVVSQECSGSICLRFKLLECQCKQEENLCDLCCKRGEDGECKPIRDMGVSNITNAIQQFPGAPCDNFNGYCDVFLKCRAVDADGPLSRLKNKFFSKEAILGYLAWIKEHWWAVLLMGIGLILLMAGKIYHSVVVGLEIKSFRFQDEDEDETVIFSSRSRALSSIIWDFTIRRRDGRDYCYPFILSKVGEPSWS